MRFIPTKVHGLLDYLVAGLLILSPWLFGFSGANNAQYVPIAFGLTIILYSVVTNYELGAARVISMPMHLILDFVSGVILACSPWLFHFNKFVYLPHLLIGIVEIFVSILTMPVPGRKKVGNMVERGHRV